MGGGGLSCCGGGPLGTRVRRLEEGWEGAMLGWATDAVGGAPGIANTAIGGRGGGRAWEGAKQSCGCCGCGGCWEKRGRVGGGTPQPYWFWYMVAGCVCVGRQEGRKGELRETFFKAHGLPN